MTEIDEKERQQASPNPEHSDGETATTAHGIESHPNSITSPDIDEKLVEETGFEPIRPAPSQLRRLSIETISTLRRERSNNGWGVDDIEDDAATATAATGPDGQPAPEVDPFEVGWENGDADEMCPRSFPTWRKWLIVIITSIGSVCV